VIRYLLRHFSELACAAVRSVLRSSHRLAIKRHDAFGRADDAVDPPPEARFERRRFQNAKHLTKRVVRRRAMLENPERLQP